MLPLYYEYHNPVKILSGEAALENIPYELGVLEARAPLLLSDAGLVKAGAVDTVLAHMKPASPKAVFTEIPPDSSVETVNHIARFFAEQGCDSILAVGGGSVIDTAKGVRMVIAQGAADLESLMGCEVLTAGRHIPFIAVPTTAGTGSECTPVAVISNPEKQVKQEYISAHLLPDAAILDVRMTLTLPPRVTASTGVDALCHAIEAYTCLQRNPMSDGLRRGRHGYDSGAFTQGHSATRKQTVPVGHGQRQPYGGNGFRQLHGGIGPRHWPQFGRHLSCGPRRRHEHSPAPCNGL